VGAGMQNGLTWKPVSVRKIKMRELIEACGLPREQQS